MTGSAGVAAGALPGSGIFLPPGCRARTGKPTCSNAEPGLRETDNLPDQGRRLPSWKCDGAWLDFIRRGRGRGSRVCRSKVRRSKVCWSEVRRSKIGWSKARLRKIRWNNSRWRNACFETNGFEGGRQILRKRDRLDRSRLVGTGAVRSVIHRPIHRPIHGPVNGAVGGPLLAWRLEDFGDHGDQVRDTRHPIVPSPISAARQIYGSLFPDSGSHDVV